MLKICRINSNKNINFKILSCIKKRVKIAAKIRVVKGEEYTSRKEKRDAKKRQRTRMKSYRVNYAKRGECMREPSKLVGCESHLFPKHGDTCRRPRFISIDTRSFPAGRFGQRRKIYIVGYRRAISKQKCGMWAKGLPCAESFNKEKQWRLGDLREHYWRPTYTLSIYILPIFSMLLGTIATVIYMQPSVRFPVQVCSSVVKSHD